MIPAERKNLARESLLSKGNPSVGSEALQDIFERYHASESDMKTDHVHILSVELYRRGVKVKVEPQSFKKMVGISGLMGAEADVVVLAHFGSGKELALLAYVVCPPHADEGPLLQVVFFFGSQGNRVYQDCQIVRVAAHHLDKSIFPRGKGCIVDSPGVHLAEAKLAPLSNKAVSVFSITDIKGLFILIAYWCAIDNN